jgi:acetylornithine/succinyldiaminopimelate/putrescine aminotransferase
MAATAATLDMMLTGGILENCRAVGAYFFERLRELKETHHIIVDVRGRGLIVGVELSIPGDAIVSMAMDNGVLINCTNGNVLRFVPPLIITREDVDRVVEVLDEVMRLS